MAVTELGIDFGGIRTTELAGIIHEPEGYSIGERSQLSMEGVHILVVPICSEEFVLPEQVAILYILPGIVAVQYELD